MNKKCKLLISILIALETSVVFMGCDSTPQSLNKVAAAPSTAANVSVKSDNPQTSNNVSTADNIANTKSTTTEASSQNLNNTAKIPGKSVETASASGSIPSSKPIDKTPASAKVTGTPAVQNPNTTASAAPAEAAPSSESKPSDKAPDSTKIADTSANKSTSIQSAIKAPVTVAEKDMKSFSQTLSCDIKIPVIEGLQNKTIQSNINTLFEYDILSFKSIMENQAETGLEESKKENYPFRQYVVDTTYKVHYNQNGILSITVTYYEFTDGAHGMTTKKAYNYDLNTGKTLKLSDLFSKSSDYVQVISTEILNDMKADPSKYFDDSITSFKNIDVNNKYYIENGDLVIYYDLYEIAPYVSGIPEFKIPFSKLNFADTLNIK